MAIEFGDGVIDTRDLEQYFTEYQDSVRDDPDHDEDDWDQNLIELADDCRNELVDYYHGETLILDSYFETYAKELAEDCGTVKKDDTWPNNHIDWEAAAEELKDDYEEFVVDGVSYWGRS